MKKLLITLVALFTLSLVLLASALLFSYSSTGNRLLKNYIASTIEEETGLPVEVKKFTLNASKVKLLMQINRQMEVEVVSHYNLWRESFDGIYRIYTKGFSYDTLYLREMHIKGDFKGVVNHFMVDGRGSALNAPLHYQFWVVDRNVEKIEAKMKDLSLFEVLALAGEKNIANGKIDIDIHMPNIGAEGAKGYGHIHLKKALFNRALIKQLYHYTLPKGSNVTANIDAKLQGKSMAFDMLAKSNLFTINVKEGEVDLEQRETKGLAIKANYAVDVKDLRILSHNKLFGALGANGTMALDEGVFKLHGESHSLGGRLRFDIAEKIEVEVEQLALEKVLKLVGQPLYAQGVISGKIALEKTMHKGDYHIAIKEGEVDAKQIEKHFGYALPPKTTFTVSTQGQINQQILDTGLKIRSTLLDVDLTDVKYGLKTEKATAQYSIKVEDMALLMAKSKTPRHATLQAQGSLKYDNSLTVDGTTSGLAKKLQFHYDHQSATLDAVSLMLQKVWILSGLPSYVHGEIESHVKVTDMQTLDGSFSLEGKHLVTQPKAMQKLLGKALKINMHIKSNGTLKRGTLFAKTTLKTDMGDIVLSQTVLETKTERLKSHYSIDIPNMQKLYPLTDKKLYGKLYVTGNVLQERMLRLDGLTHSLGGEIRYLLKGDKLTGELKKVPVDRMMGMLGLEQTVLGSATGVMHYDFKKQKGDADIRISSFQIKPNQITNSIKVFIGKDPARIIFKTTTLHAHIDKEMTTYSLHAKGTHASIDITQGKIDQKRQTHHAKIQFTYEKYVIHGVIKGTIENPRIVIDPASMIQSQVNKEIGKGLDKVLKGKVGSFLKGLKF